MLLFWGSEIKDTLRPFWRRIVLYCLESDSGFSGEGSTVICSFIVRVLMISGLLEAGI